MVIPGRHGDETKPPQFQSPSITEHTHSIGDAAAWLYPGIHTYVIVAPSKYNIVSSPTSSAPEISGVWGQAKNKDSVNIARMRNRYCRKISTLCRHGSTGAYQFLLKSTVLVRYTLFATVRIRYFGMLFKCAYNVRTYRTMFWGVIWVEPIQTWLNWYFMNPIWNMHAVKPLFKRRKRELWKNFRKLFTYVTYLLSTARLERTIR